MLDEDNNSAAIPRGSEAQPDHKTSSVVEVVPPPPIAAAPEPEEAPNDQDDGEENLPSPYQLSPDVSDGEGVHDTSSEIGNDVKLTPPPMPLSSTIKMEADHQADSEGNTMSQHLSSTKPGDNNAEHHPPAFAKTVAGPGRDVIPREPDAYRRRRVRPLRYPDATDPADDLSESEVGPAPDRSQPEGEPSPTTEVVPVVPLGGVKRVYALTSTSRPPI